MPKPVPAPRRSMPVCLLLAALLPLAACTDSADETAAGGPDQATQRDLQLNWRQDRQALGEATYEDACASCHDSGEGGAPVTGRREDWDDRSRMWQAVLFNHAREGYLTMPEKGGRDELSDEAVEAAAEYMLNLTFPELPQD